MAFNGTLNLPAMEPVVPLQYVALPPGGTPIDLNTMLGLPASLSTPFRKIRFQGNADWHTPNTGPVYLGWSSVPGYTPIEILPGEVVWLEAPVGGRLDMAHLVLDGNGTDAVTVVLFK